MNSFIYIGNRRYKTRKHEREVLSLCLFFLQTDARYEDAEKEVKELEKRKRKPYRGYGFTYGKGKKYMKLPDFYLFS